MIFKTMGDPAKPAILFFHAMGVTGDSSVPVAEHLKDRYSAITNTSLEGAKLMLLDYTLVAEANRLAEHTYCFQFASVPDFLVRMQAAKFIPHTDMNRFPTVREKLK